LISFCGFGKNHIVTFFEITITNLLLLCQIEMKEEDLEGKILEEESKHNKYLIDRGHLQ